MVEKKLNTKVNKTNIKKLPLKQKSPKEVAYEMKKSRRLIRKVRYSKADKEEDLYERRIILIRRVARVYKGGKRMRLSVFIVVGNKKGNVGVGLGKGEDVRTAEEKAYNHAIRSLCYINLKNNTIPHEVQCKFRAAKILLKPAASGTGIIAGSSVRAVVELAGIKDILTKQLGARNPINNAYATLKALKKLKITRL